jgi:signal transduction histidine kinase
LVESIEPRAKRLLWHLEQQEAPVGWPRGICSLLRCSAQAPDAAPLIEIVSAGSGQERLAAFGPLRLSAARQAVATAGIVGLAAPTQAGWRRAIDRAAVCETLARLSERVDPTEAYAAGFLADAGAAALAELCPGGWRKAAQLHRAGFSKPVRQVFGLDLGTMTARLAETWGFSEGVVDAVGWRPGPATNLLRGVNRFLRGRSMDDLLDELDLDGNQVQEAIAGSRRRQDAADLDVERGSATNWAWEVLEQIDRLDAHQPSVTRLDLIRRVVDRLLSPGHHGGTGMILDRPGGGVGIWFDHRLDAQLSWGLPIAPSRPVTGPLMQVMPRWAVMIPVGVDPGCLHVTPLPVSRPMAWAITHHKVSAQVSEAAGLALEAAYDTERKRRSNEAFAQQFKQLDQRWRQRLEANVWDRLLAVTGGAAHEMNNPLMIISGRAQVMAARLEEDDPLRADAEQVHEAAQQLSDMISEAHGLSEPVRLKMTDVSPMDIIQHAAQLAADKGAATPSVIGTVPTQKFRTDKQVLAMALSELLLNAHQVDPKSPSSIQASVLTLNNRFLFKVSDTGPGVDRRILSQVFDPYFSVRKAGRGAGLGLARARRWVEALGGRVRLTNRMNGGVEATIAVPNEEECGSEYEQRTDTS